MSRTNKVIMNISASMLLEVITVISTFILPQLIIRVFGSELNGLTVSITNFIGYIAFLQSGVGSVIRAALYKPLARKDHQVINVVINTSQSFFRKIAFASIIYIIILAVIFPLFLARSYDFLFVSTLVIIIGISTSAQYFFGVTYQILLEADQKSYIYSFVQIIVITLNTIISIVLIRQGYSIHIVQMASSILLVLRPAAIKYYAKKKYVINLKSEINKGILEQRWDSVAQAIAYFVHTKLPVFLITLFADLQSVSVYSVYALVTSGLNSIISSVDRALKAAMGNIMAKDSRESIMSSFWFYIVGMNLLAGIFFGTGVVTIEKFICVYTKGVADIQYNYPVFGFLLLFAEFMYCLRMPYAAIVSIEGKFRETKKAAYLEVVLNAGVSSIGLMLFGISGCAMGISIAMIYRTISYIRYLHSDVIFLSYRPHIRQLLCTVLAFVVSYLVMSICLKEFVVTNLFAWIIYAGIAFIGNCLINVFIHYVFNKEKLECFIIKGKRLIFKPKN